MRFFVIDSNVFSRSFSGSRRSPRTHCHFFKVFLDASGHVHDTEWVLVPLDNRAATATNQKVGSSNLSGRAILFEHFPARFRVTTSPILRRRVFEAWRLRMPDRNVSCSFGIRNHYRVVREGGRNLALIFAKLEAWGFRPATDAVALPEAEPRAFG